MGVASYRIRDKNGLGGYADRQSRGISGPSFSRASATTSPGSAWRPRAALEKIGSPSIVTSKRPLSAGIRSRRSMTGAHPFSSSSVRPTALGT